jgi:hypothetical protein
MFNKTLYPATRRFIFVSTKSTTGQHTEPTEFSLHTHQMSIHLLLYYLHPDLQVVSSLRAFRQNCVCIST